MADQPATTAPTAVRKPPKGRSPSYPGIDLEIAIQRAQRLYEAQREHPSRIDAILGHWDYKPNSGAGLVAAAALKKFGLLQDEGSGKARQGRLTELALRIVKDRRPDSTERAAAIRQAALAPTIHRDVWDRYQGQLPDNSDLIYYLEFEKAFTSHGAKEFVEQFRRTIAFAQLAPSDSLADDDGDTHEEPEPGTQPENLDPSQGGAKLKMTPADSSLQTVPIPLPTKPWGMIQLPETMSEESWSHMLRFFEFMKPSVVKQGEPRQESGEEPQTS